MKLPLLVLALLAFPLALASHDPVGRCDGDGEPALGIIEVTGGRAEATLYVDDRNFLTGDGTWGYIERNGIWTPKALPGVFADDVADHDLQRGGGTIFPAPPPTLEMNGGEICVDDPSVVPDFLLF